MAMKNGNAENHVVDESLQVKGITHLHVCDASILPHNLSWPKL